MRNKLKQLMKKEEGFTLVELLAVIVILGIIVAIAIPAIGTVISNAQGGADDAEETLIVDAARLYFIQNEDVESVTVKKLVEDGYIDQRQGTINTSDDTLIYRTSTGGATLTPPAGPPAGAGG